MEYQLTARDERFFRIFGMLGRVKGYKTLKSIYRILESEYSSMEKPPSYVHTWKQDFFGPESLQLLDDLTSYMTRTWLLCSPFLHKSNGILEPIHHIYSFSLRGADTYTGNFENILEGLKAKNIPVEEFIRKLVIWKTLPSACTVGKAMLTSDIGDNSFEPVSIPNYLLTTEEPMLTFNNELIERLYEWYNDVFEYQASTPIRVEEEFLLNIRINPKAVADRYNYLNLRLEWDEVEKSRQRIFQTLDESFVPYDLREKLRHGLEAQYDEVLEEIRNERKEIQAAFEIRLKKVKDLSEKLSKTSIAFGFKNDGPTGYIRLYLPEEAKEFMKSIEDYLYLWHSFQPSEIARLVSEYGMEKVKMLIRN
jgi:hypothetical protein